MSVSPPWSHRRNFTSRESGGATSPLGAWPTARRTPSRDTHSTTHNADGEVRIVAELGEVARTYDGARRGSAELSIILQNLHPQFDSGRRLQTNRPVQAERSLA